MIGRGEKIIVELGITNTGGHFTVGCQGKGDKGSSGLNWKPRREEASPSIPKV